MCLLLNLQSSTVTSAKDEEKFIMIRERGSGVFAIRRVAPYTPTRSCVHVGVLKKK
jgi:hypothetical protein